MDLWICPFQSGNIGLCVTCCMSMMCYVCACAHVYVCMKSNCDSCPKLNQVSLSMPSSGPQALGQTPRSFGMEELPFLLGKRKRKPSRSSHHPKCHRCHRPPSVEFMLSFVGLKIYIYYIYKTNNCRINETLQNE